MKTLFAFLKKEAVEQLRSGRLLFLAILFMLFGVMNPAVAKLTPWLLEIMADSLAASGMVVTSVTVTAMDSWVQFFKNMPMALIAFVLLQNSIFTREYQSGTLILSLTKGLGRYQVVIAKTAVLTILWTAGFWLCFGITYIYNACFWDNAIAQNLMFSVSCWWLFGLWVVLLTVLFSVLLNSSSAVLLSVGGSVFLPYLLGFLPKIAEYLPTRLTDSNPLILGTAETGDYIAALLITAGMIVLCFAVSIPVFNKKQL